MGERGRPRREAIAVYTSLHDYLSTWADHTAHEYLDDYFTGYNQAIMDVLELLEDLKIGRDELHHGYLSENKD